MAGQGRRRLAGDGISALRAALGEGPPPFAEAVSDLLGFLPLFDLHSATTVTLVVGSVAVATAASLLLMRERKNSAGREHSLRTEVATLRGAQDRADLLMASERQFLISWTGRDGEPRFEGDPTVAGEGATVKRVLAFGAWIAPADAAALESALDGLRQRGEAFRLTVGTLAHTHVDVEGRTLGGRAILRLREVTGDRAELVRARTELREARGDLAAMTALLDTMAHPLWIRDDTGRLVWANRAYLRAVEAHSIEDAAQRSLELLDRPAREEANRRRANGAPFDARLTAVMAGQRHVLDVAERPTPRGSAGIAVDVSELEGIQAELKRQMEAHVRTLDQLPTAVAIFDAGQRLAFHNAAYQRLWGLDPAFLASEPSDGEVLDRLRTMRKLPEQADFRAWKTDILSAYRAVEPRETWWHLPARRSLRVVMNPNPNGGVPYLFDDVSERFLLETQVTALTRVQSETFDTLKEGVAVFGSDGGAKLSNRAFSDMWKLTPEMLADQPHIDA